MKQIVLVLSLMLGMTAALVAQQPHGLWLSGGIGPGWSGGTCEGCNHIDRSAAISGFLRVGTNLRSNTLVGVEVNGWTRTPPTAEGVPAEDANERVLAASAMVALYPLPSGRWAFIRLGLGVIQYRASNPGGTAKATGMAPSIGAGVDVPLTPRLFVTPAVQYLKAISGADVHIDGESTGLHFRPDLWQLCIGLTYR